MSGKLAGLVWDSNLPARLKPLAAVLADYANDDGTSIYPSVKTIGARLSRSRRTVQTGLSRLRAMGILVPVYDTKGGGGRATRYMLVAASLRPYNKAKGRSQLRPSAPNEDHRRTDQLVEVAAERAQIVSERAQDTTERAQLAAPDPSGDPSLIRHITKPAQQRRSSLANEDEQRSKGESLQTHVRDHKGMPGGQSRDSGGRPRRDGQGGGRPSGAALHDGDRLERDRGDWAGTRAETETAQSGATISEAGCSTASPAEMILARLRHDSPGLAKAWEDQRAARVRPLADASIPQLGHRRDAPCARS